MTVYQAVFLWCGLTTLAGMFLAWRGSAGAPLWRRLAGVPIAYLVGFGFTVLLPLFGSMMITAKLEGDRFLALETPLPLWGMVIANIAAAWWLWRQISAAASPARE